MNPFTHNKYIGPEYFCDRVTETKEIISALDSGRSITIYADRRIGKTALIKHVLYLLKKRNMKLTTAYVDIFDTVDQAALTKKLVSGVITAVEKGDRNIFNTATKYFSAIKSKLSLDPITNMPEFSFDIQTDKEIEFTLSTLFSYLKEKRNLSL
jgi:AAA+ ATPase superfamily predicted ATPase